jgi:hypothetical protein
MLALHSKDQTFINKSLALFGDVTHTLATTTRRVHWVVKNPPLVTRDMLRQIILMKPCDVLLDVRDQELRISFYKEGEEQNRKRLREPETEHHPFADALDSVAEQDRKVVDTVLNYVCGLPNLCLFEVTCVRGATYDLVLHNLEAIHYVVIDKIVSALSTFIDDITFDFPNHRVHFYIIRNDSL